MSFKKIIILLFTIFFLFSCVGGENDKANDLENNKKTSTTKVGLKNFPGKDFSINIPVAWNNITTNRDIIPTPSDGFLELAVTSTETKNGFANNLIILSQELGKFTTSKDYSITNNIGAENEYLNYFKKLGREFTFADGEKSMLYIFEAKYSAETPVLKFLQTAYVCKNKKAFFITIALPIDIKDTSKYQKMIASFKCK